MEPVDEAPVSETRHRRSVHSNVKVKTEIKEENDGDFIMDTDDLPG